MVNLGFKGQWTPCDTSKSCVATEGQEYLKVFTPLTRIALDLTDKQVLLFTS